MGMTSEIKAKIGNGTRKKNFTVRVEKYNSAQEVVQDLRNRPVKHDRYDMAGKSGDDFDAKFRGVESYDKALELMANGYQPTVEKLEAALKMNKKGEQKRIKFENNVHGFAPVVPLAMKGVPTSMINMTMAQIKCKVVDVYYDMGVAAYVSTDDIIKAGQKLLATIIELEKQGYRFNLYAVQAYSDESDADVLCVKVKSSDKPIDLKRISFPLTHPAFFRVIGFDWQGHSPIAQWRGSGRGRALTDSINYDEVKDVMKQTFGSNAVYLSCNKIRKEDEKYLKEVLTNAGENK